MDAVYFQLGTLIQAEQIPGANYDLPDGQTLSWGHAMKPPWGERGKSVMCAP
jgi:hypothetical protein